MLLFLLSYHLLPTILASPVLATDTSAYRAHIRLYNGVTGPYHRQDCVHIPPGGCCRQLNVPGSPTRFATFDRAYFNYMDEFDLGLIWTPDRPAPLPPTPSGTDANLAENPLPSVSGCAGRVLGSSMMRSPYGADYTWGYETDRDVYGRPSSVVTGASYLRLSPHPDVGFENAAGFRAMLGGGGAMFGVRNRTDIATYPYRMPTRRGLGPEDGVGLAQWVWPDQVTINGTEYAQVGGKESLVYRSGAGEALDLEPWNA